MRTVLTVVVGAAWLLAAEPGLPHHSFTAEFDVNRPFELTGTVSSVEWTNPHARFFIEVVDEDETVATWSFELASPNSLTRSGWGRRTLSVGDTVTVTGFAARSGRNMASTRSVTLADGSSLFSGTQGVQ